MSSTPPSATTQLMPGYRLDRYELLAPIAEGGMGAVWLARLVGKRGFEKLVAIKVPKLAGDAHVQQMLLDEARIASGIEHTNVAKILELGEQGDTLYIVMEFIEGVSLSGLVRELDKTKVSMPPAIALRILSDTCAGVHAAHELSGPDGASLEVVHRDISPQNMLIATSGSIKLIDFGIAKARSRGAGDTTDGTLKGKLKYMAPEQALGKKVDRRADVFALGAVLYRLLAGRSPYDGDNELATLNALISGRPPVPLPASIPKGIQEIAKKALSAEPAARFQTALEMHHAIAKAMAAENLVAESADVAAFVVAHLGDRLTKLRKAIDFALHAAAKRAAVNELLCATEPQSSPTISSSGSHTPSGRSLVTGTVAGTATDLAPLSRRDEAVAMTNTMESPRRPRALFASLVASGTLALIGVLLAIAALTMARSRPSNASTVKAAATQVAESATSEGAGMPPEAPLQAQAAPPVAEAVPPTTAQAEPSPPTSAQTAAPKPASARVVTPVAVRVVPPPRPKPASSTTSRDFGY